MLVSITCTNWLCTHCISQPCAASAFSHIHSTRLDFGACRLRMGGEREAPGTRRRRRRAAERRPRWQRSAVAAALREQVVRLRQHSRMHHIVHMP